LSWSSTNQVCGLGGHMSNVMNLIIAPFLTTIVLDLLTLKSCKFL
jgi:hypothetical protein